MNAKFLMSCAALGLAGLGGLASSTEVQARTSDPGLVAEAHEAATAPSASQQSSSRPDLLIAPGKIGGISLIEQGLVRGIKVASKYNF
jgi:hypothetical protein